MDTPVGQLAQGRRKKALPPTISPLLAGSLYIQDTQPVVTALRGGRARMPRFTRSKRVASEAPSCLGGRVEASALCHRWPA